MSQLYMDKILSGLKTEVVWPDSADLDDSSLIPVEVATNTSSSPKPTVSIIDLGKMLLQCAKEGDTIKVHDLMCRGAPFTTDWLGTSALHLAALHNHYETCEILLRAGISKDARTKVDRTPLHLAVYEGHERIVELLLSNKCEVNARDMLKMTPLHWAIEKRHRKIVSILLKHGADPCASSKFFITPLSLAMESNQNDVFQELLSWNIKMSETELACDSIQLDDFIGDSIMSSPPPAASSSSSSVKTTTTTTTRSDFTTMASEISCDLTEMAASSGISPSSSNSTNEFSNNIEFLENQKSIEQTKPPDSEAMQMLRDHGISMLDDSENTLFNSALQNGRKLVLSDAGKLLLNDLKLDKKPIGSFTTSQAITTSKTTTIAPASRTLTATTTTTITNNNNNNNNHSARIVTDAKSKQGIVLPTVKQLPITKSNKVIKILSADEFKQMYGGNIGSTTVRKVASNNIVNGNVKYQTNSLSTISKPKRFIINKSALERNTPSKIVSDYNVTPMRSGTIPIVNGKSSASLNQHQRLVHYPMSDAKKLDIVSKYSTIQSTTGLTLSSSSSSNQLKPRINKINATLLPAVETLSRIPPPPALAPIPTTTTTITTATGTIPSPTSPASSSSPPPPQSSRIYRFATESTTQTEPTALNIVHSNPMILSEIERQILELKKQTEELRKQLELSKKQTDEYKVRLEKLEREKALENEERDRNKGRLASHGARCS